MWFIILFAVCCLAIPVSLEIHARGHDNILVRSGRDLADTRLGLLIKVVLGQTISWIHSLAALSLIVAVGWVSMRLAAWLLRAIF